MEKQILTELRMHLSQRFNLTRNQRLPHKFYNELHADMVKFTHLESLADWGKRIERKITYEHLMPVFHIIHSFMRDDSLLTPGMLTSLEAIRNHNPIRYAKGSFTDLVDIWEERSLTRIQMYCWYLHWNHYRTGHLEHVRTLSPAQYQRELRLSKSGKTDESIRHEKAVKSKFTELNANQRQLDAALAQYLKYQSLVYDLMNQRTALTHELHQLSPDSECKFYQFPNSIW